ncbi:secreted salivary gland peptide, putative, partial [Ixodes scapularis]
LLFLKIDILLLGVCKCHNTCDDSGNDSPAMEEGARCKGPPASSIGRMSVFGFFYDQTRDECRQVIFGDGEWNKEKNKFQTLQECRQACRSKKRECVVRVPVNVKSAQTNSTSGVYSHSKSLYALSLSLSHFLTTSSSKIFQMIIGKFKEGSDNPCLHTLNHFRSKTPMSVSKCKLSPLLFYLWINACLYCRVCKGYIEKKCNMPPLTSKYCGIKEKRYWYNATSQQCEESEGCEDDALNFKTAKACWMTCSSK